MKRFVLRAGRSPACKTLGASVKRRHLRQNKILFSTFSCRQKKITHFRMLKTFKDKICPRMVFELLLDKISPQ